MMATLLPDASATAEESMTFARQHILKQLPENPTGAVLKRELRERFDICEGAA